MSQDPQHVQRASSHSPPPFRPQEQGLGGIPSILPDVPISAVFLILFLVGGATHMTLFFKNKARGRKFVMNAASFGFCVTRVLATAMRIVWATFPRSVKIGMAAQVFVYAGIIILFLGNATFAQRIIRAQHPHLGWSRLFTIGTPVVTFIAVATILMLIPAVIYSFYTLNQSTLDTVRVIQLVAQTIFTTLAFLPIPMVALSSLGHSMSKASKHRRMDNFGKGSMRTKVLIVVMTAALLTAGACYRATTLYLNPVPITESQPWYFQKALFYVFNFTLEAIVIYGWLLARVNRRFRVPDGAKGPFSYGGGFIFAGEKGNEKTSIQKRLSTPSVYSSKTALVQPGRSRKSSRASSSRESQISWGGPAARSVDILDYAEGPSQYGGYPEFDDGISAMDVGVSGVDEELGWDTKTGEWKVRPVSSAVSLRRVSSLVKPASVYSDRRTGN